MLKWVAKERGLYDVENNTWSPAMLSDEMRSWTGINFPYREFADSVAALEAELAASEKERNKWRNYMPDDEELAECKKQACYKGEYKDSLAANHVYIVALETRYRELETQVASLREIETQLRWLIANSRGVDGFHMNGDLADWDWLINNECLSALLEETDA